jgi:hypothetical protein
MTLIIANINDAEATKRKIKGWTGDNDNVLAINYQIGGWAKFSNTVFKELGQKESDPVVNIAYDPPGQIEERERGFSQHTHFDNISLSSREDPQYEQIAVDFFGDFVLSAYLRPLQYNVEPTLEVQEALGGAGYFPKSVEDIARMLQVNPNLLANVQCVPGDFDPKQLSPTTRMACLLVLEDQEGLASFLESPETTIRNAESLTALPCPEKEINALIQAANEKPDVIRSAFDSVALGRARGDGNTYILLGINLATGLPDKDWFDWIIGQLDQVVQINGFLPVFGYYVTAARSHHTVVLGPGVTEREKEFLTFFGHKIIDRRNGEAIGKIDSDE